MGHAVEKAAISRGHSVPLTIDTPDEWLAKEPLLGQCDLAIEFSTPATAVDNIHRCLNARVPVVAGTTGWFDQLDELKAECLAADGAMFVASNFSIGMNIVFELNRRLAQLTKGMDSYAVSIEETHHIHKLDAPSGTAIHLAEGIIAEHGGEWRLADSGQDTAITQSNNQTIPITAIREGEVTGIHKVRYDSAVDTITLTHEAKSREGLAQGAVLAAEYLHGKKGFFTMRDLLRIES